MDDAPEIHCLGCGYILKGLTEHRCPECGRPFDPADPGTYYTKPVYPWRWLAAAVLTPVGAVVTAALTAQVLPGCSAIVCAILLFFVVAAIEGSVFAQCAELSLPRADVRWRWLFVLTAMISGIMALSGFLVFLALAAAAGR